MMQATSVQPPKTVRIIPATIDTKAAITQNYRQLRVAAYCRVSSTVSISGSSSNELYLDFLIQFLSTFRVEGFYSLFCGPVFEPLTWSCQATAPHSRLACAPRPCASPAAFSAACGRSGFRRGGTLGQSCPGRSDSCGGATGSLPASQRADGFPPSGSEGTVHFVAENIVGELGLDLTDALFGEVGLSRLCGPGHHVDVRALALVVKGGVPAEVTGRYLCGCVV